jgi:hypothetical protein
MILLRDPTPRYVNASYGFLPEEEPTDPFLLNGFPCDTSDRTHQIAAIRKSWRRPAKILPPSCRAASSTAAFTASAARLQKPTGRYVGGKEARFIVSNPWREQSAGNPGSGISVDLPLRKEAQSIPQMSTMRLRGICIPRSRRHAGFCRESARDLRRVVCTPGVRLT